MLTRATADLNEIEWSMLKGMEGFMQDHDDYRDLGAALYEPKIDLIGHCHYPYFWRIDCYCRAQFEKKCEEGAEKLAKIPLR